MVQKKKTPRTPRRASKSHPSKSNSKNGKPHRPTRVKRVPPDKGPVDMSAVAAELGYQELAKQLTYAKPKPILADIEKRGNVTFRRSAGYETPSAEKEFSKRIWDMDEREVAT